MTLVSGPAPVVIRTLGPCELWVRGDRVSLDARNLSEEMEVLLALVALGGRHVSRGDLTRMLWPDRAEEDAANAWYAALHRLQLLLGRAPSSGAAVLSVEGSRLSLHPAACWADCWAFQEAVNQAQRLLVYGQRAAAHERLAEARACYRGAFLADVTGRAWVDVIRHTLAAHWRWVQRQGAEVEAEPGSLAFPDGLVQRG